MLDRSVGDWIMCTIIYLSHIKSDFHKPWNLLSFSVTIAQNIIHIGVVSTHARPQRGNIHATFCNMHNPIISAKSSDFHQTWNLNYGPLWVPSKYFNGIMVVGTYACVQKCNVYATALNVHNQIAQPNQVWLSPNFKLYILFGVLSIKNSAIAKHALPQRGNVHATFCNVHNLISHSN